MFHLQVSQIPAKIADQMVDDGRRAVVPPKLASENPETKKSSRFPNLRLMIPAPGPQG
jgi:hypothetical protein